MLRTSDGGPHDKNLMLCLALELTTPLETPPLRDGAMAERLCHFSGKPLMWNRRSACFARVEAVQGIFFTTSQTQGRGFGAVKPHCWHPFQK